MYNILVRYAASITASIFIFTLLNKLYYPQALAQFLDYFLNTEFLVNLFFYLIVFAEGVLVTLLLFGSDRFIKIGAFLAIIIPSIGIGFDIVSHIFDLSLNCGCFGYLFETDSLISATLLKVIIIGFVYFTLIKPFPTTDHKV